ncbi:Putative aminoacrylate hydrolase RutD [Caballeronia terrestris]|jgi:pimeloyl-ACP methyl ester carboxylesterase|uniref:Aminoacrylate hydrolase RutD n=1 Tax=Caballeronia terrestris TaxID=1226301 RepID=A0A158JLR0_9BURK|nr:alpha/beta hydrolase [Caballeronia terrestris]SAL69688.1 Putative aminoacrylate hydrolase RutD [Caballeronia terrestris]
MSEWILLRGLTREARHWGAFPERFRTDLNDASGVTLIDLPGIGAERALPDVASMATFVRGRANAMGLAKPYRLLAMSLGAMAATEWATRHPEEIDRLVLINTSMRPFARSVERLRPAALPAFARIAAAWNRPQQCEAIIHRLTCNRRDTAAADIAEWTAIRASSPVSAASALRQLWAAARFRAPNTPSRCPTLLLSSAADGLVDPVCSARIATRWGTAHAEHPWAGHDLPHDDPAWTCRQIGEWLRSVDMSNT